MPKNGKPDYIEQLFTKRQFFCLSLLLNEINTIQDLTIKNLMKFVFSASLNKTNLTFSSTHGEKQAGEIVELCTVIVIGFRHKHWI